MVKYGRKNASLNSFCNDVVITDLGAYFTADPEKADEAAKIARSIIEAFARKGPTDEEMKTVRKQFQNIIEQSQKTPRYWAGVLSDLDYHKTQLSDVKEALEKYTTYTKEDILNALKKYIVEDRRFQVIALPKKSGSDSK